MKKNIALIWGGYSSEAIVSEKSMLNLYECFDKSLFNVYKLQITKEAWTVELNGDVYPINKNDFSFENNKKEKVKFDFAYITIHGTPGENGLLQGYLEMLDIPHSTCNAEVSSLLFNKFYCNNFLSNFSINVAKSVRLTHEKDEEDDALIAQLSLPLFVKPCIGGSSFATTKVNQKDQLRSAINIAFKEAPQVMVESFISGTEVTCGCLTLDGEVKALPLTEVVSKNEFFDFEAKYNGAVDEITPARISDKLTLEIQEITKRIYYLVEAKGIIRADFIIQDNVPYLLEVNTTPGMTSTSFIPQQVAAANLNMTSILTAIVNDEFKDK